MSGWAPGVRLGVDVGRVRIGVAVCDPEGILAVPLATVARRPATEGDDPPADIRELTELVRAHHAVEVVVGLPVTLAGREGLAAAHIRAYANLLSSAIAPIPVRLHDERMTTVLASRRLTERNVRGRRQRAVIDQAAAVEILQGWLDTQRRRT